MKGLNPTVQRVWIQSESGSEEDKQRVCHKKAHTTHTKKGLASTEI